MTTTHMTLKNVVKSWYEKYPDNDDLTAFLNSMVEPYRQDPKNFEMALDSLTVEDKAALYEIHTQEFTGALTDAMTLGSIVGGSAAFEIMVSMIKANTIMGMALIRHITTQE